MKQWILIAFAAGSVGCASITNDAMTPIALSFSTGEDGTCEMSNKRGAWTVPLPRTSYFRRSDDALQYRCETESGQRATGAIPSTMGGKIIASAVFIDFGITDAITDKHREYPQSYVIPVSRADAKTDSNSDAD